jgi:hypothetical protein
MTTAPVRLMAFAPLSSRNNRKRSLVSLPTLFRILRSVRRVAGEHRHDEAADGAIADVNLVFVPRPAFRCAAQRFTSALHRFVA